MDIAHIHAEVLRVGRPDLAAHLDLTRGALHQLSQLDRLVAALTSDQAAPASGPAAPASATLGRDLAGQVAHHLPAMLRDQLQIAVNSVPNTIQLRRDPPPVGPGAGSSWTPREVYALLAGWAAVTCRDLPRLAAGEPEPTYDVDAMNHMATAATFAQNPDAVYAAFFTQAAMLARVISALPPEALLLGRPARARLDRFIAAIYAHATATV